MKEIVSDDMSDQRMGAGWIDTTTQRRFLCGIANWPSSTREELCAIFTALLAIPEFHHVDIRTDSQAALDGISKISQYGSIRTILGAANNSIICKIIELIQLKSLTVKWTKVKAHEGDINNELADELAKEALELVQYDSRRLVNLDVVENNSLGYKYRCKWNNIDIDMRFRGFVKMIETDKINAHWSLNKAVTPLTLDHTHVDWDVM